MKNFFKNLFRKKGATPETPVVFKTRVENYSGDYYIARYFNGLVWRKFCKTYHPNYMSTDLWDRGFPVIGSFDEMVRFCKLFKSLDEVKSWQDKKFAEFSIHYQTNKYQEQQASSKSWTSDPS